MDASVNASPVNVAEPVGNVAALAARPVRVIGVPSSLGGRMRGPEQGPDALRAAGLLAVAADAGRVMTDEGNVCEIEPHTVEDGQSRCRHLARVGEISEALAAATLAALREGAFPLVLGGDHSLSIGSIAGAGEYCRELHLRLGVLWIDAHPDLNTPETTPSGNIHGMVLGAAFGLWQSSLSTVGGNPDFVPAQLAYAGLRSIDPGEQEAIEHLAIYAYSTARIKELGTEELLRQLRLGPLSGIDYLHVSLDLDAADPAIAPGVSTPEPDGLSEREVAALLAWASLHPGFRSMDIAELNPERDIDGRTAAFALRMARVALETQ